MTGITAQHHHPHRSNLPDLYGGGGGTVDLEEQRAIMDQIERERAAASAAAASSPSAAEEEPVTPQRRTRTGPPPSRRRSRSLERPSLPTPTAFAGMAEASAADSPGIVRNASSNYDDDGHEQSFDGVQPYFGRWDSDKTDNSDVRRRIVPDRSAEEADAEPYFERFESDNTYGSDATFGAAEFADQLTALERKDNVAEAAARMGKPTTHHRQHLSVPASSGFSSSRPDVRERSVRFHEESSSAMEEEQKAILREIERQRRLEREEKEEQRAAAQAQHRQHKSMPAALDFDDSAVEEQMAIMREIERQQRQQKQEKQRRDEEEERRRQQQEEPQRPTHRSAKTLPADRAFLGGTSLDEQRAIMERIEREQQKGRQQEQPPSHRATKSNPNPSASSWDRKSSSSARPDDMAAAKLRYRPSSSSSSSRSPGFRGNAAAQRLDERIKRKSDQFGGSGSFSSSPPRVETIGSSKPASSPVGAHESFSSSTNSPTKLKGNNKKKDEGSTKRGVFTRPSSSSSSAATARTSSSSASTFNSSSAASASADEEQQSYVSGRHRVVLVDGRDAVARSGGTKKVVTCAGCSKRLTVSRTCEVVFCPKCETLTPAALSTEVGAWGEGM